MKIYKNDLAKMKAYNSYDELLKSWAVEYVEKDISTSFGNTHCIFVGDRTNQPLLLFHGVGDNSAVMWALNIQELSKYFYCIAIDTLGGPGKSIPNEKFTKNNFTQKEWIDQIIFELGFSKVFIAGVSNGAAMAFNYTVNRPEKVIKAVCIEGGMIINPIKSMIQTLGIMFPEILIPTNENMKKCIKKLISPNATIYNTRKDILDHIVLLMKNHNQKAMFVHDLEKFDRAKALPHKDKFYFLYGDFMNDKRIEFFKMLDEDKYNYKIIKDAGHGLNHEQYEITNKEVISFLLQT